MIILSYNYLELGNPQTIHDLCLLAQNKPDVIFLMEMKLEYSRLEGVKRRLIFTGCMGVYPMGRKGGLALMWKNQNDMEVLNFFQNHIISA